MLPRPRQNTPPSPPTHRPTEKQPMNQQLQKPITHLATQEEALDQ
ncbi:hypothetical protein [Tepidiforma sp.]|nr:hypothetical protein [Tepidiforma sp.]